MPSSANTSCSINLKRDMQAFLAELVPNWMRGKELGRGTFSPRGYFQQHKLSLAGTAAQLLQRLLQRLYKEVFAPDDGLIDAQFLRQMVDAALEYPLPLFVLLCQMMFAQGAQDANGERPIVMPLDGILEEAAQA